MQKIGVGFLCRILKLNPRLPKFIETVLKEISSGVIAIDKDGNISLYNYSAKKLLDLENFDNNTKIFKVIPEIADLIYLIQNEPANVFNENIIIMI
jgi:nitrogen fixation/metabolism regulation signal transduction histidine kinase